MSAQVIQIPCGSTGITLQITVHPDAAIQNVDEAPLTKFEVCGVQNGTERSLASTEIVGDYSEFRSAPANGDKKTKELTKNQRQKRNRRVNEKRRLKCQNERAVKKRELKTGQSTPRGCSPEVDLLLIGDDSLNDIL